MGRRRKANKHLPRRVYLEHGRYWFKPISGGRIDLGTTECEMYDGLAKLADTSRPLHTMGQIFDRYLVESLPKLSARTQRDYRGYIENLRKVYDTAPPDQITASMLVDYRAKRSIKSVVQANRELSCMSAVFRDAIGWHAIERNPCRELKRLHEPARTRYVTDAEFSAVYAIASECAQCFMDLATITGQREGDLLKLPARDPNVYMDDGIVFHPGKSMRRHPRHGKIIETAKTVIVEWSPELRAAIERARKLGPDIRKTLICNLQGKPYSESGFRANWHRLIQAALKGRKARNGVAALAPVLTEPFTIHDLRAKSASDDAFEDAHERLAHDDPRTTQAIYRRKPRRARAGRKVT